MPMPVSAVRTGHDTSSFLFALKREYLKRRRRRTDLFLTEKQEQ